MKRELLKVYKEITREILKDNFSVVIDKDGFNAMSIKKAGINGRFARIGVDDLKGYSKESIEDVKSRIQDKNISIELFCLLHEIGHIKTYNKKIDKRSKKYYNKFYKTNDISKANKIHNKIIDEKLADGFANNFINNNKELVNKWNSQIMGILN